MELYLVGFDAQSASSWSTIALPAAPSTRSVPPRRRRALEACESAPPGGNVLVLVRGGEQTNGGDEAA